MILLPIPVEGLLAGYFSGSAIGVLGPTFGGFSHRSAIITAGGRHCVVKAADAPQQRADLRREARVLARLRHSNLPTPALTALIEDAQWTVEVLDYVPGENAIRAYAGPPEALAPLFTALGRTLALVHRDHCPAIDTDLALPTRARGVHAALPGLGLDPALEAVLLRSLEHPAWHEPPCVLVHGDAGLHNVLWDGQLTALLDWEWAGYGNPLLDLSWVFWTMRWRRVPDWLWPVFLAGYGPHPALGVEPTAEALRALALGQIAGIIVRVAGKPDAAQEWLRRAWWTLDLAFPSLSSDGGWGMGDG